MALVILRVELTEAILVLTSFREGMAVVYCVGFGVLRRGFWGCAGGLGVYFLVCLSFFMP
jgi:hypothetical protein